jgi:hypothetical protein
VVIDDRVVNFGAIRINIRKNIRESYGGAVDSKSAVLERTQ